MSFFGNILGKLGMGGSSAARPASPPRGTTTTTGGAPRGASPGSAARAGGAAPSTARTSAGPPSSPAASAPSSPAHPQPIGVVDVVAQLEQRAAGSPEKLNWRTSIVDLLKLLDIDSSLAARKKLAKELGCPPELMGDSAKMNPWLHKTVLTRIAANGGNVPQDLLH